MVPQSPMPARAPPLQRTAPGEIAAPRSQWPAVLVGAGTGTRTKAWGGATLGGYRLATACTGSLPWRIGRPCQHVSPPWQAGLGPRLDASAHGCLQKRVRLSACTKGNVCHGLDSCRSYHGQDARCGSRQLELDLDCSSCTVGPLHRPPKHTSISSYLSSTSTGTCTCRPTFTRAAVESWGICTDIYTQIVLLTKYQYTYDLLQQPPQTWKAVGPGGSLSSAHSRLYPYSSSGALGPGAPCSSDVDPYAVAVERCGPRVLHRFIDGHAHGPRDTPPLLIASLGPIHSSAAAVAWYTDCRSLLLCSTSTLSLCASLRAQLCQAHPISCCTAIHHRQAVCLCTCVQRPRQTPPPRHSGRSYSWVPPSSGSPLSLALPLRHH